MSSQRYTIALLVDYVVSTYQVSLMRAVERATSDQDVNLLVLVGRSFNAPTVGDRVQTRLYEMLHRDRVDGVILTTGCLMNYCGPNEIADYCARLAPIPVCSIAAAIPGVPSVVVSNRGGSRAAVEHLITEHGAQRIACIRGPEGNHETQERYAGYREALEAHGLPFEPAMVTSGDLGMPAGIVATRDLFARGVKMDALVAANDYMAMGALEVMHEMGLRVPDDVMLAGFDDATFARFALPALTTVRQPLDPLGRSAVEKLLRVFRGEQEPLVTELEASFVARQSCGCRLGAQVRHPSMPAEGGRPAMLRKLREDSDELVAALHKVIGVPPEALGSWATRLITALEAEVKGRDGAFTSELEAVLERAAPHPDYVDELFKVVSVLRSEIYERGVMSCDTVPELEQIWHTAQLLVGNAAINAQGRTKLDLQVVLDTVRTGFERIATSLTLPSLKQAIATTLPDVQIHHAYLALALEDAGDLKPFLTVARERVSIPPTDPHPANQLVPPGFFPARRHSHIVLPLTFEGQWYGIAVMEYTSNETVYGLIREQISSALKGGELYRTTLQQAAQREKLEREALEHEAHIAARIQTKILPRAFPVKGLDVAARMTATASVGGDYYDVIPVEDGAWLGIGDVTGHGLFAGLVMMMMQGMIASLVRRDSDGSPAELITAVNATLYDNLRDRLERDDHATLAVLRFEENGTCTFAGAHEEIIVYRAASRRCELWETKGVWVGTTPDISAMTEDERGKLEDGDLLVLFTDGITEALNEKHEQYGLERLCRLVRAQSHRTPHQIADAIIVEAQAWQTSQLDDQTVIVARHNR